MSLRTVVVAGTLALAGAAPTLARAQAAPSPAAFHGYELGTRYTLTSALVDYYRALADASPRVEYREYGRSVLGRPLPMVIVGSEANVARLDDVRAAYRRLASATDPLPDADFRALTADLPAVVWVMIVDTDEEAGVEVLQEVAWELATRDDDWARATREDVVVVMTPLTNPDSHARYVTWQGIYGVEGASLDPQAVENRAHWAMNTDGNAWGVDVNRDFGFFITPEMSALGRAMMSWRPPILLDVHSGPAVIFLPPFPRPFHPLWPAEAPDWWNVFARRANERFGEKGWSFSSRKDYEGVAGVGFGLSWAMLGTTVSSYLFETFGGRPGRSIAFTRTDGTEATMRMAMDRHKEGVWSLLDVVRDGRARLLRDQHDKVVRAVAEARALPHRGVVIPAEGPGVDPDKVRRLVDRLLLQEVEVHRAPDAFTAPARDFYALERTERRTFPAGSWVVDFTQANARLARALLDPTLDFTRPEVEVPYDRKMPYYDAPWGNLPHLFGVRSWLFEGPPPAFVGAGAARVTEVDRGGPGVVDGAGGAQPYAWILPPGLEADQRVATALLQEGYRVRVFTEPFRIGEARYPQGTLALLRGRNPTGAGDRLEALVGTHGAHAMAVAGPFTDAGLTFGDDERVAPVPTPRIAVLADWPVTQDHTFGGIRSTLEADFGMAFSPVMMETLNGGDLGGYTAVVLPHAGMDVRGGPNFNAGYRGRLDLANLRRYVTGGGTLIAVQGAAAFLAQDEVLGRGVDLDGWAERTEAAVRATWTSAGEPAGEILPWRPGLDEFGRSLLAAGMPEGDFTAPASFPVLLRVEGEESGGPAGAGTPGQGLGAVVRSDVQVVARYAADPGRLVLDGFMLDEDRPVLAGRPFALVAPVGRGRVIYFAEDLTFRGQWAGLNGLFWNALVLGSLVR
ncbi:MAG: peptidase M14 [Gemmatimonadota bacterium]